VQGSLSDLPSPTVVIKSIPPIVLYRLVSNLSFWISRIVLFRIRYWGIGGIIEPFNASFFLRNLHNTVLYEIAVIVIFASARIDFAVKLPFLRRLFKKIIVETYYW